jgi:hypothetical protein
LLSAFFGDVVRDSTFDCRGDNGIIVSEGGVSTFDGVEGFQFIQCPYEIIHAVLKSTFGCLAAVFGIDPLEDSSCVLLVIARRNLCIPPPVGPKASRKREIHGCPCQMQLYPERIEFLRRSDPELLGLRDIKFVQQHLSGTTKKAHALDLLAEVGNGVAVACGDASICFGFPESHDGHFEFFMIGLPCGVAWLKQSQASDGGHTLIERCFAEIEFNPSLDFVSMGSGLRGQPGERVEYVRGGESKAIWWSARSARELQGKADDVSSISVQSRCFPNGST